MPILNREQKRVAGLRRAALVEMALFFAIASAVDWFFGPGRAFSGVSPHPYWGIVLLMAAQYGTAEALTAAAIAAAFRWVFDWPASGLGSDLYTHMWTIAAQPLGWLVSSVLLGEIQRRHQLQLQLVTLERGESIGREMNTRAAFEHSQRLRGQLETIVASNMGSAIRLFEASRQMEKLDPHAVLEGVSPLIQTLLGAEKFSVYVLNGGQLDRVFAQGWTDGDRFAAKFRPENSLFQRIVADSGLLCAASAADEAVLAREGVLAGPLTDPESGAVLGMLKVEQMPFQALTSSSVENFRAVCDWTGRAYGRALQHQRARDSSMLGSDSPLLSAAFFERQTEFLLFLARRLNFDLSLVRLRLAGVGQLDNQARSRVAGVVDQLVHKQLRRTDLAFETARNAEYSLLLTSTPVTGAAIVVQKLQRAMPALLEGTEVSFVTSLHALHERVAEETEAGSLATGIQALHERIAGESEAGSVPRLSAPVAEVSK